MGAERGECRMPFPCARNSKPQRERRHSASEKIKQIDRSDKFRFWLLPRPARKGRLPFAQGLTNSDVAFFHASPSFLVLTRARISDCMIAFPKSRRFLLRQAEGNQFKRRAKERIFFGRFSFLRCRTFGKSALNAAGKSAAAPFEPRGRIFEFSEAPAGRKAKTEGSRLEKIF